MALIKTDSQNYTDIANAIREVTGSTEQYKPEEMAEVLDAYIPDYGISYDSFDANGNLLTASTYGYKVAGFMGNKYLQTVNISENATEIGRNAFTYCYNLSLSVIPASISKIEGLAFSCCDAITSITFEGVPTKIGNSAFNLCDNLTTINVPWAEGEVSGAPWGASNATINYNYTG